MILRRVILHFRKQEWTAIFLDFLIVVAGVFVGIQVSNWNAARQQSALAGAYVVRLGGDLSAMETYLERMIAQSSARYDLSVDLLRAASDRNGADDALVGAAEAFFTKGWKRRASRSSAPAAILRGWRRCQSISSRRRWKTTRRRSPAPNRWRRN